MTYCSFKCHQLNWNDHRPSCFKPEEAKQRKLFLKETDIKECNQCQKTAFANKRDPLLLCARCKSVRYCNTKCQTHDWEKHRKHCMFQVKKKPLESTATQVCYLVQSHCLNTTTVDDHYGQAEAHNVLAVILHQMGQYKKALHHAKQQLVIANASCNVAMQCRANYQMGIALVTVGHIEESQMHQEKMVLIAYENGFVPFEAFGNCQLGHIHRMHGRFQKALAHYKLAFEVAKDTTCKATGAIVVHALGNFLQELGESIDAVQFLQEALVISSESNEHFSTCLTFGDLGDVYLEADVQMATKFFRRALVEARFAGFRMEEARFYLRMARVGMSFLQDFTVAHQYVLRYLWIVSEAGSPYKEISGYELLAEIECALGAPVDKVVVTLEKTVDLYHQIGISNGWILLRLGIVQKFVVGEAMMSITSFQKAGNVFNEQRNMIGVAITFRELASVYNTCGKLEYAIINIHRAITLFEEMRYDEKIIADLYAIKTEYRKCDGENPKAKKMTTSSNVSPKVFRFSLSFLCFIFFYLCRLRTRRPRQRSYQRYFVFS